MSARTLVFAPASGLRRAWFALPAVILLAAALLANLGVDPTPEAVGATTDTVTVNATVGSVLDVADVCAPTAGTMSITVAMSAYTPGTCAINFGASNDSSVMLTAADSNGGTFFASNFADEGGTCANLATADKVGLFVQSVGGTATNQWGCATEATTAGNNNDAAHKGVPDTAANVCQSTALGTANTCTIGVGVLEVGGDAPAAVYSGIINLAVTG